MDLNYRAIGQRIRTNRLSTGISQEQLAEQVALSPTHMSNIETGTTRVSLSALVSIANALGITMDDLLCDNLTHVRTPYEHSYVQLLSDCSTEELRLITATAEALKAALRSNAK